MQKTIRALKRGVQAASQALARYHPYRAADKPVVCSHCGGTRFRVGMGFPARFSLCGLACERCGHVELFTKPPEACL